LNLDLANNKLSIHKGFIFLLLGISIAGCASHRTAMVGWEGERIRLEFTPPIGGSPVLKCLSCNLALAPLPLQVNDAGIAYIKIDEAKNATNTHFRLSGSGIDTAFILSPLSPEEAAKLSHMKDEYIGRAMITRYANIYEDTSMIKKIGSLERQDEVNLFGKDDVFYYIHHPGYNVPVVILRSHAIVIK
jgi:hypothetical protein